MKQAPLEPAIIVIFGITGDLSQRYLLPALYHLIGDNLLHEKTEIIGVSRRDVSADELLGKTELCVLEADSVCDPSVLKRMHSALSMFKMDLGNGDDYAKLHEHLNALEIKHGVCMNRLYYLSIPPGVYQPIVTLLGEHGLNASCQHGRAATRLLVEKPFGYDLPSARELITETGKQFGEEQIFRIDHYLAKETVQNILTFRFHNPIFEAIWDNEHVASITIEANEKIGIEGRAGFYEQTGALRDFVQSHLLQLLAVTTMEKPAELTSEAIHAARLKLLLAIEPVPTDKVTERAIRGQYDSYRAEVNNTNSPTETYAALKLFINNPRWRDVPVTIRTGKALREKKTAINITFKQPDARQHTNTLTFSVQPSEGIGINLCVKHPGFDSQIETATMDFSYERTFDSHDHPNAYERVLVDAVRGDRTLFATGSEVLASWRILESVIEVWAKDDKDLQIYKTGSIGPKAKL
ncbi:MAG TPA: glucose-6-phosphate dehydrogenase [Candidatus Saccharimonadales bacterium]|jgi:glucose-6-phosphate 1-dehydrogenase